MKNAEKFALGTGIIGLIADLITIGTVIITLSENGVPIGFQIDLPSSIQALILISLVYSWLLASWFLVRRIYLQFKTRTAKVEWKYWENLRFAHSKAFLQYVIGAVFGLAVFIVPLLFLFGLNGPDTLRYILEGFFILIGVGVIISLIIMLLMPIIYPDVEADLFSMLRMLNPFHSSRR